MVCICTFETRIWSVTVNAVEEEHGYFSLCSKIKTISKASLEEYLPKKKSTLQDI